MSNIDRFVRRLYEPNDKGEPKRLNKWQSNQIVLCIRAANLEPNQFRFINNVGMLLLDHYATSSRFDARISGDETNTYAIGEWRVPSSGQRSFRHFKFDVLVSELERWLVRVSEDVHPEVFWEEILQGQKAFESPNRSSSSNTPFTPDERADIAERLHHLSDFARNQYHLSDDQVTSLKESIDYLIEASQRLGRIDWKAVLLGTLISYMMEAAFSPDSARQMLSMAGRIVVELVGGTGQSLMGNV